ncbi:helicase associated domain-containing protein [Streptomyces sp. ISL-90]|nr:helicase associated domain-containing protein [Streptomyces sp. ISL-90]
MNSEKYLTLDLVRALGTGLAHLDKFIARERHSTIPVNHIEEYFALGRWARDLREARRSLPPSVVEELQARPEWSWKPRSRQKRQDYVDRYDDGLLALLGYVEIHGTANVSQGTMHDGVNLGRWVKNRRDQFLWGQLTGEQISQLESLPEWTWNAQDARFEKGVDLMIVYALRHGTTAISQTHREGEFPLGRWVYTRRREYAQGTLREDRILRLQSIPGWNW